MKNKKQKEEKAFKRLAHLRKIEIDRQKLGKKVMFLKLMLKIIGKKNTILKIKIIKNFLLLFHIPI